MAAIVVHAGAHLPDCFPWGLGMLPFQGCRKMADGSVQDHENELQGGTEGLSWLKCLSRRPFISSNARSAFVAMSARYSHVVRLISCGTPLCDGRCLHDDNYDGRPYCLIQECSQDLDCPPSERKNLFSCCQEGRCPFSALLSFPAWQPSGGARRRRQGWPSRRLCHSLRPRQATP